MMKILKALGSQREPVQRWPCPEPEAQQAQALVSGVQEKRRLGASAQMIINRTDDSARGLDINIRNTA